MVARIHSGDPALWGAVQEQRELCDELGLRARDRARGQRLRRGRRAGRPGADRPRGRPVGDPHPARRWQDADARRGGAAPSSPGTAPRWRCSCRRRDPGSLQAELLDGGYPPDTPVLVAYRATWPDELLVECTVGTLAETVKAHKLWKHTLFLVGPALAAQGHRSHLYHPGHFHGHRRADPEPPGGRCGEPGHDPARPPRRARADASPTCPAPPRCGPGRCGPAGPPARARPPRPRPRPPPCGTSVTQRTVEVALPSGRGSASTSSPACTTPRRRPRSWSRTRATTPTSPTART